MTLDQQDIDAIAAAVYAKAVATPFPATLVGRGEFAIDHSGGLGAAGVPATLDPAGGTAYAAWATDALRVTRDGTAGVGGLNVRAYLRSAYDAVTGAGEAGATTTKADGRWAAPLNLASGDYYVIVDAVGDGFQAVKVAIRVA